MWIMTHQGIFMPATVPVEHRERPEWNLQVRARERKGLVKVRKAMIREGCKVSPIVDTRHMDYEYRFYCNSRDYGRVIAEQIAAIDYEKFKPTTYRKGGGGDNLHSLFNELWGVIARHYDSPILDRWRTTRRRDWWEDAE